MCTLRSLPWLTTSPSRCASVSCVEIIGRGNQVQHSEVFRAYRLRNAADVPESKQPNCVRRYLVWATGGIRLVCHAKCQTDVPLLSGFQRKGLRIGEPQNISWVAQELSARILVYVRQGYVLILHQFWRNQRWVEERPRCTTTLLAVLAASGFAPLEPEGGEIPVICYLGGGFHTLYVTRPMVSPVVNAPQFFVCQGMSRRLFPPFLTWGLLFSVSLEQQCV
ncbi:hypothetical protein NDU88_000650 [Pleurodeles waltl]|uniref:Uncharacterized protein n=1 Tax=Pleurodeles waltl TaxID=8319 RepID=A0AAV7P1X4_PLEWA|nr:hypothetical protein NDU88_000650 [Pleurodeles waltl]